MSVLSCVVFGHIWQFSCTKNEYFGISKYNTVIYDPITRLKCPLLGYDLKTGPFETQTDVHDINTGLIQILPRCILFLFFLC